MSKSAFCWHIILVVILLIYGIAFGEDTQLPVQDHRTAIDIGNRVSGFDRFPNFSEIAITVQKVVVAEDNTSLYEWIEGRTFWKVSYSGVVLRKDGQINPYINAFDVFVDVETGRVAKIASQWVPGVDIKYRQTEATLTTRRRQRRERMKARLDDPKKKEQYELIKVPESYPRISFLESLKPFIEKSFIGDELHTKHIVAIYRLDQAVRDGEEVAIAVWYLAGLGGKLFFHSIPVPSSDRYKRDDTRVHKNMTIDAETGEKLSHGGGSI